MKNYFLTLIAVALFIPTMHAMKRTRPDKTITSDSFTEVGENLIGDMLSRSHSISYTNKITTGLIGIFDPIWQSGVHTLLQDKDALEKAGAWYNKISEDPVFVNQSALLNYDTIEDFFIFENQRKDIKEGIARAIVQLNIAQFLLAECPEIKTVDDQLQFFALVGSDFEPPYKRTLLQFYQANSQIDQEKCAPYVRASVLLAAYLVQTITGR